MTSPRLPESFLEISAARFSHETRGKGDRHIVLISGWASVRYFWEPVIQDFMKLGKVSTLDLYGHYPGSPPKDFNKNINVEELVKVQAEALRHIANGKKVTLVGHSTGGYFALSIASQYPELVEKVVGIAPVIHGPVEGMLFLAKLAADHDMHVLIDLTFEALKGVPLFFERFYKESLYDSEALFKSGEFRAFFEIYYREILKINPRLMGTYLQILDRCDLRPILSKCEVPVLVLAGTHDKIVNIKQQREVQKILSSATYIEYKKSGHIPILEEKEAMKDILDWIEKPVVVQKNKPEQKKESPKKSAPKKKK